jgi:hypothetical protein
MNEMIERVARAIADAIDGEADKFTHSPQNWELWVPQARAAVEAMREPTERMAYSGSWAVGPGGHAAKKAELAKAYTAMIDAALKAE